MLPLRLKETELGARRMSLHPVDPFSKEKDIGSCKSSKEEMHPAPYGTQTREEATENMAALSLQRHVALLNGWNTVFSP